MLKLITPATEPAVTLSELKAHIRNTQDTEDSDLDLKVTAAERWIAGELGRPLITSTWEQSIERWPYSCSYLDLPGNTQSIISIKYTDWTGAVNTVSPTLYKVARAYDPTTGGDSDSGAGRLYLAYGQTWPTVALDTGEPIVVRLVAGWADAASLPVPIKQAILMVASHWYRNRDAVIAERGVVSEEIAIGVERLLSIYTDRRF